MKCTAWVHGIHPQRLGFFEDRLYRLVKELGKAGVEGHQKEEIEEEGAIEDAGAGFGELDDERDEIQEQEDLVEPSLSDNDAFLAPAPCQLGCAVGRPGASKWWRAERFFKDLQDYWIERKSAENQEYWRKMDEWEFEGKLIRKNRSYLRLNRFSWDEVG